MAIDMGGLAFGRTGDSAGCTLACARDVRRKRNEILTPPLLVLPVDNRGDVYGMIPPSPSL
jgi:hypothetical protein